MNSKKINLYTIIFTIVFSSMLVFSSIKADYRSVQYMSNGGNERGYFDGVNYVDSVIYGWVCKKGSNSTYSVKLYSTNVSTEGRDCVVINNNTYCSVQSQQGVASADTTIIREGTGAICGYDKTGFSMTFPEELERGVPHNLLIMAIIDGNEHFLPTSTNASTELFVPNSEQLEPDPDIIYDYNSDGVYNIKDLILLIKKIIGT